MNIQQFRGTVDRAKVICTPEQFVAMARAEKWREETIALLLKGRPPLAAIPCGPYLVEIRG